MTDGFKLQDVSDDQLRAYLLGELSEQEGRLLDQRLLTDDEFAQSVWVAESLLIDEFVAGELKAGSEQAFRATFLKTDVRREQLRLASALHDLADRLPALVSAPDQPEKRSWRAALAEVFTLKPRPAWAAAGSFALLVLVLGLAWYLSRQSRQSETPIAQQSPVAASPQGAPSPAQIAQVSPLASSTPEVKPTPSEPPVAIASFVLLPGALRGPGEMTRVAVPRGERAILRLNLILENPAPGPYRAELANPDGQTVTVRNNLKPRANGQTKVVVEIPARLIQTGDYQIKLTRQTDGQFESVGRYYFRALPE